MPHNKKIKKIAGKILLNTKSKKPPLVIKAKPEKANREQLALEIKPTKIEILAEKFIKWVGSMQSLLVHTILFLSCFVAGFLGVDWNEILLVLTTIVSLEAIYLAIFIQMSINKTSETIANVEQDIDEIAEDVEDIAEDVEDIAEDVGEIQTDVDELHENLEEIQVDVSDLQKDIDEIQDDVTDLSEDLEGIAKEDKKVEKRDIFQKELLKNIHKNMNKVKGDMERLKISQQKQKKLKK